MKKNKYDKRNTFIFYLITVLIGILVCMISFAFAFNFFSHDSNNNNNNNISDKTDKTKNISSGADSLVSLTNKENKFTALVINIKNDALEIFNLNKEVNSKIKISSQTEFFDKNNIRLNISKLKPGDIVDIISQNGEVKKLNLNKLAWQRNYITGFKINYDLKEFYYDNKKYFFDKNIFIKDDKDINKISSLNLISIKGLDKKILYLEINKATGFIKLLNANKITNGLIKIDSDNPIELKNINFKELELSSGPHNIFITGDNIESYSKDFFINPNDNLEINLLDIEFKSGILKLNINQSGCEVYINNKKTSVTEPILLNYGEYDLKITKPDFNDYLNKVIIDSDIKELNIKLSKKVNLGKVKIMTKPDNAQIYLDDAFIGPSPIETLIEYGKHVIHIKKDSYKPINFPIEINKQQNNYEINLEPESSPEPDEKKQINNNKNNNINQNDRLNNKIEPS